MEIIQNESYNEGYSVYKAKISCLDREYAIRIAAESFEKALEMANEYANGDLIVSVINTNKNIIIQKGFNEIK
jgi:hypothetical protein